MQKKMNRKALDLLFRAILTLQNEAECDAFLEDLCTMTELTAMGQRIQVAQMLQQNMVYHEIAERTGASSATISRVNRALQYGNDGYQLALSRLEEDDADG